MTGNIRWLSLLWILISASLLGDVPAAAPTAAHPPIVVAELFTSEGCSSCPPADIALSQLAHQPLAGVDVLTIGEHVDYWDRLGWRDRFSSAEFSARQSTYDASTFHRREVYTPQLVIDGRFARVGSDVDGIRHDIERAAAAQKAIVDVQLAPAAGGHIRIDLRARTPEGFESTGGVDAVFAVTEDALMTEVRAGENRGRRLRHDAVARWMTSVGMPAAVDRLWECRTEVPIATEWNVANVKVIGFLQERASRRIIGAGVARLMN